MKWYEKSFNYLTYFTYFLYIVILFGLWGANHAEKYLDIVNYWREIIIGILLIYFFHPFRTLKFNDFHRKVAFNSGIFILGATILTITLKLNPFSQNFLESAHRS